MELLQAINNLKKLTHKFPEEEINCIRENKEEAIPILIDCINNAMHCAINDNLDKVDDIDSIAIFLLAEFKVNDAFLPLLKWLECGEDIICFLLDDLLTEDFGAVLASVATPENIPEIKKVIENKTLYAFNRLAALNALITLYTEGVYTRDDFFNYLGELLNICLDDKDEENENEYIVFLCYAILEVYASDYFGIIKENYLEMLIDWNLLDKDDFNEIIKKGNVESSLLKLKSKGIYNFITDTVKSISCWVCFREKPDFGRKIGRNELCPCGSGKKYKKCCGY